MMLFCDGRGARLGVVGGECGGYGDGYGLDVERWRDGMGWGGME
jgi:hypothetical protein